MEAFGIMITAEIMDGPLKGMRIHMSGKMAFVMLESPPDMHNKIRRFAVKEEDIRIETYELRKLHYPNTWGLFHRHTTKPTKPRVV
jgi:hypothetical protein